jgi:hypothetical protein
MSSKERYDLYMDDLKEYGYVQSFESNGYKCVASRSKHMGYWIGQIECKYDIKFENCNLWVDGRSVYIYKNGDNSIFCIDCASINDFIPGDVVIAAAAGLVIPSIKIYRNFDYIKSCLINLASQLQKLKTVATTAAQV